MNLKENTTISIGLGTIVKFIIVVLLFALGFILKDLLLVVLLSIVVASAVEPGTLWFQKRGVPRLFGVILIYLTIAICLVGIIFFLLLPLLSESMDFLQNSSYYFNPDKLINDSYLSSQPIFAGITNSFDLDKAVGQINTLISTITSNTFGSVTTIFGGILSFLLTIILSFYLAVEEDGVGKFLKAITTLKHEGYVVDLWKRSQKKIGLWMQGQLVLAVIIGMLVYLGLLIINVPNALLLAVLAAAFEIIPLFGPILASIPAIMIAFVTGGMPLALVVMGLYIIIHQFENQLIYPLVVKKVVGVSPVVSILALAAGWELAGFIGLILSVPVASAVIEFFDDFEKNKIEAIERMNQS
jgi:predicted PurR-regulated permease PerM